MLENKEENESGPITLRYSIL